MLLSQTFVLCAFVNAQRIGSISLFLFAFVVELRGSIWSNNLVFAFFQISNWAGLNFGVVKYDGAIFP